jgi:hypothetical protein
LTIVEIERGTRIEEAKHSPHGPTLRSWFNAFRMAYAGRVLPFNEGAAIALEFGYALATRNVSHFNFSGLTVVDPWA